LHKNYFFYIELISQSTMPLTAGDQLELHQINFNGDPLTAGSVVEDGEGLHLVVLDHCGSGAFGSVVLCWLLEGQELVALKMFQDVPADQHDVQWQQIVMEYKVRTMIL
jgi:hypothetical protein